MIKKPEAIKHQIIPGENNMEMETGGIVNSPLKTKAQRQKWENQPQ
jgi:hypothetical protein